MVTGYAPVAPRAGRAVRTPDRVAPRAVETSPLAIRRSVRVWNTSRRVRSVPPERPHPLVWLPARRKEPRPLPDARPRHPPDSGVPRLGRNDPTLHRSESEGLALLRRPRDSCLSALASFVRGLPRRRRPEAGAGSHARSDREQPALQTRKRPMGHAIDSVVESAKTPSRLHEEVTQADRVTSYVSMLSQK